MLWRVELRVPMDRQLHFKSGSQGDKKASGKRFRSSLDPDQLGKFRKRVHLREITDETPNETETVGSELRAARLRAGKSVREVAEALRFRVRQLEALEQGDHQALPGATYAIGFVRAYAEHLGLNPDEFVRRFKAEMEGAKPTEKLDFPVPREESRVPAGLLVVLVVIVGGLGTGVWFFTSRTTQPTEDRVPPVPDYMLEEVLRGRTNLTGEPGEAPATPEKPPAPQPAPAEAPEAAAPAETIVPVEPQTATPADAATPNTATPGAIPGPNPSAEGETPQAARDGDGAAPAEVVNAAPAGPKFAIRAQASAWLRIDLEGGGVLVQRILDAGEVFVLPEKGTLTLTARNAGAFELIVNGQVVGRAGLVGQSIVGKQIDMQQLLNAAR